MAGAVDGRLPLKRVGGGEGTGWLVAGGRRSDYRVAVAMAVVPANTPVMTGQTEICITLGEARFASFSAAPPGKRLPRSPSNRRTFSA
jgi:hypothetical protein